MRVRTLAAAAGIFALSLSAVSAAPAGGKPVAPPAAALVTTATAPNVVVVVTDDQRWDTLNDPAVSSAMPNLKREVLDFGVRLNGFTTNSWCCPGRAGILTGDYSHTNEVYTNGGTYGGFGAARKVDGQMVNNWLHGAGYRTGMVGKWFNGYVAPYVPPGWDYFSAFTGYVGNEGGAYYDYDLVTGGVATHYGTTAADYSTDVLANSAVSFLQETPADQPAFLYFAPFGPHAPATPAPRHASALNSLQSTPSPSLGEADVADKPAFIRELAQGPTSAATFSALMRKHMRPLMSEDDAIGRLIAELKAQGRWENTVFILVSDNGYGRNEHRWFSKEVAYEESIRVPMVIRYDPWTATAAPRSDSRFALNIDLAPTIAEAAGVTPSAPVDGQSLRPLLTNDPTAIWRTDFLVEHLRGSTTDRVPTFCAVRNEHAKYVRYRTGEEELYDLDADPFELQSQHGSTTYAAVKAAMLTRLRQLCSPPPPGFTP